MRIEEVAKGLCSGTRLNIIRILAEGDASAISVYKQYNVRFSERKERATIYRDLEVLYKCNFLFKRYDGNTKEIIYGLAARRITVDLLKETVEVEP
jgi:DNA-binding transcriptional ArsR family regulator